MTLANLINALSDNTSQTIIRHKKSDKHYFLMGITKMKDTNLGWVHGVMYQGDDKYEPNTTCCFVRELNDFLFDFDLVLSFQQEDN